MIVVIIYSVSSSLVSCLARDIGILDNSDIGVGLEHLFGLGLLQHQLVLLVQVLLQSVTESDHLRVVVWSVHIVCIVIAIAIIVTSIVIDLIRPHRETRRPVLTTSITIIIVLPIEILRRHGLLRIVPLGLVTPNKLSLGSDLLSGLVL